MMPADPRPGPILAHISTRGWTGTYLPAADDRPYIIGRALARLPNPPAWVADLAHLDGIGRPTGPSDATPARWLYIARTDRLEIRHAHHAGTWTHVANVPYADAHRYRWHDLDATGARIRAATTTREART